MADTHIVIIGTGAEGRIAADIFAAMGQIVLGFLETEEGREVRDLNDISVFAVAGDEDSKMVLQDEKIQYLVALGDIRRRQEVYEQISGLTKRPSTNGIHPAAWVSPYAAMGFGNLLNAGAVVNANTQIGDMNHLHSGVTVEPDVKIGNYCTLSSGVKVGANVQIADHCFIGTGAVIHPGVKLGKGCMIGAGSVVLREVEEGGTVYGNPAKPV